MDSVVLIFLVFLLKVLIFLVLFFFCQKRKVRREQLVRKIREVVGDELLLDVIKNHRNSD